MTRSRLAPMAALALSLTCSAVLRSQVLTLVEVHADDGSPETGGNPVVGTHLDDPSLYGRGVVLSPDGRHVYVGSRGDDAVVVFDRDAGTGALLLVEVQGDNDSGETDGNPVEQTHIDNVEALAISPGGEHLYAVGQQDDGVTVFGRNAGTGALTLVEVHEDDASPETGGTPIEQTHLELPRGAAVSPDGGHVYVTSNEDDALTAFARDGVTGALALVEVHADDTSPETDGSPIVETHLRGALGVALSPDGAHVYVTSTDDDAVTVFGRDSGTGQLTLVEVHADNESSETDGSPTLETHLDGAWGIAVSPDGGFVYVTAATDDAVTVFERDDVTGVLTFVEVHDDDTASEPSGSPVVETHLRGARNLAVTDSHVLVPAEMSDAVTVFARDGATGALTLVEVHADDESTEPGGSPFARTHLDGATSVAVSPGGAYVYATGTSDDAVTVFASSPTVPVELLSFTVSDEDP